MDSVGAQHLDHRGRVDNPGKSPTSEVWPRTTMPDRREEPKDVGELELLVDTSPQILPGRRDTMTRRGALKGGLSAAAVLGMSSAVSSGCTRESDAPSNNGGEGGFASSGAAGAGPDDAAPLNVIWISADDLGVRLGSYGDQRAITPHLDAFAQRAMTFERVYCQVAICSASRSSILTGVRPSTSGLVGLNQDWREHLPEANSLPRHLRNHGYFVQGIGKLFDSRSGDGDEPYDKAELDGRFSDERIAIEALRERKKSGRPFFLGIGFSAPHCPHSPSKESLALHEALQTEMPGQGRELRADSERECLEVEHLELSEEEARGITVRYYATVTDLDRKVGSILDEIEKLDLLESSIVLFWCGDHGYHLGESNLIGKLTNHVFSTQVPLIMHVPQRSTPGARTSRLVECVDMYPTLVDLLALPPPNQELEGLSFAPLLDEPTRAWKDAAFSQWRGDLSIKTERYNFIRYEDQDLGVALYDLENDPLEYENVAADLPEVVRELEDRIDAGWRKARPPFGD